MITLHKAAKTTTYVHDQPIITVDDSLVATLKDAAGKDAFRRARLCLHMDPHDAVQEMIIAFQHDTYVRPHKHFGKSESFHMIEGTIDLIFFDDAGVITQKQTLSERSPSTAYINRLNSDMWHMLRVRGQCAIIHEVSSGPFTAGSSEFAPWSPVDGDTQGIQIFTQAVDQRLKDF